ISGIKLTKLTQALAYKEIRKRKMKKRLKRRERTLTNLDQARNTVYDWEEKLIKDETLWSALRNKDITKNAQYFLWMAMHDAYMISDKWQRQNMTPEMQKRAECSHCKEIEDMEHIQIWCEAKGQETLWELTKKLWEKAGNKWNDVSLGLILGAPAIQLETKGSSRLLRILVSETSHLIWKLRCERVIQNENQDFTTREVHNRWTHAILQRVQYDIAMTDEVRYGSKAIPKELVEETWSKILQIDGESELPRDWMSRSVGLVGIQSQ
ncbi:hypothetical protein DL96DRAFT_1464353, partial [Flagelloscypha sp. PMI_526]